MAEPTRSIKRAICLSISLFIVVMWMWVPLIRLLGSNNGSFNFSDFICWLIGITLQPFILYRIFVALCLFPALTDRLDAFFFEDRRGSLTLLVLCVAWTLVALSLAATSLLDLMFAGGTMMDPVVGLPPVVKFFEQLLSLISPPVFLGVTVWVGIMGVKALWRITAPRRQHVEEVPLGPDEEQGDEWDGWKDNRA